MRKPASSGRPPLAPAVGVPAAQPVLPARPVTAGHRAAPDVRAPGRPATGGRPRRGTPVRPPPAACPAARPDPNLRPLPALGPCTVTACARRAESEHVYCPTHYVRWRNAVTADPGIDQRHWQLTQPAVSEGGQVSLRGLAPLMVVEVLFGVQQRTSGGAKLTDVNLRAVGDALRREQVASMKCSDPRSS